MKIPCRILTTPSHGPSSRRRRGLATLELVLVTPLLLLIMALMINYGTAACWKARCDGIPRNYVWRHPLPPNNSSPLPVPEHWRVPDASQWQAPAADLAAVDDRRLCLPVIRGPMPGASVDGELLNPANHYDLGQGTLTRPFPLLGKLPAYRFAVETVRIRDFWEYQKMGMDANVSVTPSRFKKLYDLPPAEDTFASAPAIQAIASLQSQDPILASMTRAASRGRFRLPGGLCTTNRKEIDDLVKDYCKRLPADVQRWLAQYLRSP